MICHPIVAVLATALTIGFGCKTSDPQATRDATPEIAPAIPPPPPPPPPPVVDASVGTPDAVADAAGVALAKSGKMKASTRRFETGAETGARAGGESRGRGIATLQVTGNLPKAAADEVLRAKAASFATCHDGGEHGQVQIKVTMNDRGVVEIAKVMKSTLGGGETELCLARVAQRFKFPPPPGGGESTVTFQLKF
jgi:hypothetical protein